MTTDTAIKRAALDALDLAALLCSRVCHDVISPVGAINNGLEVLEDERDEQMRGIALELIRKSARQASAKLQFARLAFGAAGSAGAQIDLRDAETVSRGFVDGDKIALEWVGEAGPLPKNQVKLLLNLLLIAMSMIPRGGRIRVSVGTMPTTAFTLTAAGLNARVPQGLERTLVGEGPEHSVDAHSVQPYYARQLAEAAGMTISIRQEPKAETTGAALQPGAASTARSDGDSIVISAAQRA